MALAKKELHQLVNRLFGGNDTVGWSVSVNIVDADGLPVSLGGGGGGAATEITLAAILAELLTVANETTLQNVLTALQSTLNVSIANAALEVTNDVGNPIPVSATSLPLPAGAATQTTLAQVLTALQSTLNVSIANSQVEITNDQGNPIPVRTTNDIFTPVLTALRTFELYNQFGLGVNIGNGYSVPSAEYNCITIAFTGTGTLSSPLQLARNFNQLLPVVSMYKLISTHPQRTLLVDVSDPIELDTTYIIPLHGANYFLFQSLFVPITMFVSANFAIWDFSAEQIFTPLVNSSIDVTTSGTVAAGALEVGFIVKSGVVTIDGVAYPVGATLTYDYVEGRVNDAIPYTVVGGTLTIIERR